MSSLVRSTATLVIGATLARGIGLAAMPILSRLYSPSEFGVFALFSSTILVLTPLSTLRYHVAIPLLRHERSAAALLILCVALALGFAVALGSVLLLGGHLLFVSLSFKPLAPYALLIPLGVFAASLFETMTMWATRHRAFNTIASAQILQSTLAEGLKIGLGFAALGPAGLILGQLSGYGSGVSGYWRRSSGQIRAGLRGISTKLVKLVAYRFRGFPITRTPGQILLALATQAPLFLVTANYDVSVAGQMSVAMLAFMAPFTLIGQAAGRAYFAEISRMGSNRPDLIREELRKITMMLGLISLPIAVILFFFAEPVAALALGEEWTQAGRFVSSLALALVPQFLSATIIRTLDVLEAHALVISLHATRLVAIIAAFLIAGSYRATPEQAVLSFSLVLAAHYLIQNTVIHFALTKTKRTRF